MQDLELLQQPLKESDQTDEHAFFTPNAPYRFHKPSHPSRTTHDRLSTKDRVQDTRNILFQSNVPASGPVARQIENEATVPQPFKYIPSSSKTDPKLPTLTSKCDRLHRDTAIKWVDKKMTDRLRLADQGLSLNQGSTIEPSLNSARFLNSEVAALKDAKFDVDMVKKQPSLQSFVRRAASLEVRHCDQIIRPSSPDLILP